VLVAGEAIAVAGLHRLGSVEGFAIPRQDLGRWLRDTPSEDVLLAGIRLAALIAAWWLLTTTLLYVAARLAHFHGVARAVGWATLPAVRRWADRIAAVSIVAACAVGVARPAAADPPPTTSPAPPAVVIDLDHRDRSSFPDNPPPSVRSGRGSAAQPAPALPPPETVPVQPPATAPDLPHAPPLPPAPATPPPAPATSPPSSSAGTRHTIVPGEHLWSIAARHLTNGTGRPIADLTPADIAPYWRRVVELNRSRLRSGDPDLVYPGEVIELPSL
jgi:resuscitation-promoting factor RpfA